MSTDESKTPISLWDARIGAFAEAVAKNIDDVNKLLVDIVGDPSDEALTVLDDVEAVPDADLKAAFAELKIPSGILNKHLSKLRGAVVSTANFSETATANAYDAILPAVPEDSSFLEILKTGGVLKVDTIAVLSAIKAAIANKLGLYDLPALIKNKMESYADSQDEPVTDDFYKLQKLVASRNYSEVLSALSIEGKFMSEAKKTAFFIKVDQHLWSGLRSFHQQLTAWQESYQLTANNPGLMMSLLLGGKAGNQSLLSGALMNPPETTGLHDEADAVINSINKVFAGVGVPVAKALAYDAAKIKEVLENPLLPASIGATNRDQMLKTLNIAVGADYIRLERNLVRYALGIMEFPKITSPDQEYPYLAALIQLGGSIAWDKLGFKSLAGIGKDVL